MAKFQSNVLRPIVGLTPVAITTLCRSQMYRLRIVLISVAGAILIIGSFHVMNFHLQRQSFSAFVPENRVSLIDDDAQKTQNNPVKTATSLKKQSSPTVHIIVLADMNAKEKYKFQLETIHCYATSQGFDFIVPTKDEMKKTQCEEKSFYLRRHCLLSQTMATYPDGDYFVLLDGDTIAFDLKRKFPVQEYLSHDLVFYERWWNGEVACPLGVRNKAETREFLMAWSNEDNNNYVPPPEVFYGTENGLLHILLIKWFVMGTKTFSLPENGKNQTQIDPSSSSYRCIDTFSKLNETVEHMDPYWAYVVSARVALGMQGLYDKFEPYEPQKGDEVAKQFRENGLVKESFNISLKILPRYYGMTVDLNMKDKASENVIFLHGVKEYDELLKLWNYREVSFGQQTLYPLCQTKA